MLWIYSWVYCQESFLVLRRKPQKVLRIDPRSTSCKTSILFSYLSGSDNTLQIPWQFFQNWRRKIKCRILVQSEFQIIVNYNLTRQIEMCKIGQPHFIWYQFLQRIDDKRVTELEEDMILVLLQRRISHDLILQKCAERRSQKNL